MARQKQLLLLPEDMIEEVALLLPAKSIGRFRCASKAWRSRLSNPTIVRAHSKLHIKTAPVSIVFEHPLLEYTKYMDMVNGLREIGEYDYEVGNSFDYLHEFFPDDSDGDSDVSYGYSNYSNRSRGRGRHLLTFAAGGGVGKLVTSPLFEIGRVNAAAAFDGLIVVEIDTGEDDTMFLFNPLTSDAVELPRFQFYSPDEWCHFLGFGYDSLNDDYKIVRLLCSKGYNARTYVNVYSFRMKSWRKLGRSLYNHIPHLFDLELCPGPGVFVNGCLHWLDPNIKYRYSYVITAFNLAREEFVEVLPPPTGSDDLSDDDGYESDREDRYQVVAFGGCLSVLCYPVDKTFDDRVDVWVMREYGVQESWNKLVIDTKGRGLSRFVCLLREDEVVFRTTSSENDLFAAYSLSTGVWRNVAVDGDAFETIGKYTGIVAFTESLLSPNHLFEVDA